MEEAAGNGDETGLGRAFSIPAYIGACATGGVSFAVLLWSSIAVSAQFSSSPEAGLLVIPPVLLLAIVAGATATLPATLFFLPATLASFYLMKRYGLTKRRYYAGFGAASAAVTGLIVTLFLPNGAFYAPDPISMIFLAEIAVAGALAGLVYRRLELMSRPNHKAAN